MTSLFNTKLIHLFYENVNGTIFFDNSYICNFFLIKLNEMKKYILMFIVSLIFGGMLFSGCSSENMQGELIESIQKGDVSTDDPKGGEENTNVIPEEPKEDIPDALDGVITYPKTGKYGLNILADDFVEAKRTEWGRFEYSVKADLSAGKSHLKIVMKPAKGNKNADWGGWNLGSDENWLISNVGNEFTCTVDESGKVADASVIFTNDCIIEFYENGATTPTKVKEIKVSQDVIFEEPKEDIPEGLDGVIIYPKTGKYGLNILADDFVEAKRTEWGRFEYSVKADLSAGKSHLKIVMKPAKNNKYPEWGGWNQETDENWLMSNVGGQFTCTVYESGKVADASVIFTDDCIIEFYENGSTTPTKVKQVTVIN